jgi:beta-lactamase regulating signal transducer with metallopeptidase domain/protein involved in polysaccharide export with SLBB domain
VALINAVMATGLAMVVWLATRVWRHPVFVHTLWIVVLLKLITPPLVRVPWRFSENAVSDSTSNAVFLDAAISLTGPTPPVTVKNIDEPSRMAQQSITLAPIEAKRDLFVDSDRNLLLAAGQNEAVHAPAQKQSRNSADFPISWTTAGITIWLSGTVAYLFVSLARLLRFHRALVHAAPASAEIQRIATELAPRFGVANRYRLRVTEGHLSPLVWPIGRPTILMPRRLLAELSPEEVGTLLAHEFSHVCRRDHWLRWLELVVTAAYWWHPVVWWAKAAIGRAEEKVCDAWVVSGFPDASARYASALFKAVQFSSADRQAAPVVASTLGGGELKERIEHIMNATWKPRLFLPIRLLVLAAAMFVLPLSLRAVPATDETIGQDELEVAAGVGAVAADAPANDPAAVADAQKASDATGDSTQNDATDAFTEALDETSADQAPAGTASVTNATDRAATEERLGIVHSPRIRPGALLTIRIFPLVKENPIGDSTIVDQQGRVALGPLFGRVNVDGMTVDEAEAALIKHINSLQVITDPRVQVTYLVDNPDTLRNALSRTADNPFAASPAGGSQSENQPRRVPVPADPYHIAAGDVLSVSVIASGTLAPLIDKDFVVEPSGSVALGPQYGRVKIGSLSLEDAEKVVAAHLKETLREPMVQITIGGWRDSATQAATQAVDRTSRTLPFPWETSRSPLAESVTKQNEARSRRPNTSRRYYPELPVSTAAPAVSESMGVLKKIVQRSEQDYQRLKELADNNTVSTSEVARAQSEYEINLERLKQGERALRFYRAQVEWAEAEFQTLDEANQRAPGSVTELDLRRAKLAVEMARAKLEELAE